MISKTVEFFVRNSWKDQERMRYADSGAYGTATDARNSPFATFRPGYTIEIIKRTTTVNEEVIS